MLGVGVLIGISVNQLHTTPEGTTVFGVPLQMVAYIYTLIFVSELFFPNPEVGMLLAI
jgi:hypothetical protein